MDTRRRRKRFPGGECDAGVRRDVSTLARLYADEYFHTNADGSLMTKAQVLDSYKAPPTATIESHRHDEDKVGVHTVWLS